MINSIITKFKTQAMEPVKSKETESKTFGESKISEVFKNATVSAACFQDAPESTQDRIRKAQHATAMPVGGIAAALAATTGATVGLHEVVGHGLLGIELTQQSGPAPTYWVLGWDNFNKIAQAGSFKDGLIAFFHWLFPFSDNGDAAGLTYWYPDQPNGIGQAMGSGGRSAWISVAGSLPGLALDSLSVVGGMYLRKRSPLLGNLIVAFGLTDNIINAAYPISAAMMSDSQIENASKAGHDFANFALKMSGITGIPAHDIAISTAVFWTAFVPILAAAAYLHTRSQIGDVVPDFLALKLWVQKAEKDPKIAAELEKYYQAYRHKDKLAQVKVEDLPSSRVFYDFLSYLLDKISSTSLDACKKEILASWDKNVPRDRIQTALTLASLAGTGTAVATKILSLLSLANPALQTAATALGVVAPIFIGASIISAGYQVYKDFQCPDTVVPEAAKMLSIAKLVVTIACAALMTTALFVPGLNLAFIAVLVLGAILNIILSYGRSQVIRDQFALQKAMSPEVWNVMYPLWEYHQSAKKPMNSALKTWTDCVSKKVDLRNLSAKNYLRINPSVAVYTAPA
jgi:hypothetical protein